MDKSEMMKRYEGERVEMDVIKYFEGDEYEKADT